MADYNIIERVLHHVALTNSFVLEATFDMELTISKPDPRHVVAQEHVFVSGLARGGTTILMRSLYESGQFGSLTYADMPFVLAPNLWLKLSGRHRKQMQAKERAHGDGILVDYNSPEALDEVFWRAFTSKEYIKKDRLVPYDCDQEVIDKFKKYIAAILLRDQGKRYLSKNNNNTLRLGSILRAFPKAKILIPFRDPLQHAHSLQKQHVLFVQKQKESPFVRHYMSWLGHHEFGMTHKPVITDQSVTRYRNVETIDYWLQQWHNVYQFLLKDTEQFPENIRFVSYEMLCTETDRVWQALNDYLGIEEGKVPEMNERVREAPEPSDRSLLDAVNEMYLTLTARSRQQLFGE